MILSVLLFEISARKDPYEGENVEDVLRGVADPNVGKRVEAPANMPEKLKSLMADCLDEQPNGRPSFEEIGTRLERIDGSTITPSKTTEEVTPYRCFPPHVAQALKEGRKAEAEKKEVVTLFYGSIVGFDLLSAKMDPRKVRLF